MSRARTTRITNTRNAGVPVEGILFALAAVVVVSSAVLTKETAGSPGVLPALAATSAPDERVQFIAVSDRHPVTEPQPADVEVDRAFAVEPDPITRWFDGRPVRPASTRTMVVSAYSPDARSCGSFADGQTATLHSVWTNAMRLVAADTDVLPFGALLSVPGYADDSIVPVLDRGGAIKGNRLDLLMPSHELARAWGMREIEVTVWEYADALPAADPRTVR